MEREVALLFGTVVPKRRNRGRARLGVETMCAKSMDHARPTLGVVILFTATLLEKSGGRTRIDYAPS